MGMDIYPDLKEEVGSLILAVRNLSSTWEQTYQVVNGIMCFGVGMSAFCLVKKKKKEEKENVKSSGNENHMTSWRGFMKMELYYRATSHVRDWEPVTSALWALSLVEKAVPVWIRFAPRLGDEQSMWMQNGCKSMHVLLHDIKWIMRHGHLDCFQKPPLGGKPNTKPRDHGIPNAHNRWFILFYRVWGSTWVWVHWNSSCLRTGHISLHTTLESPRPHYMILEVCVRMAFGHPKSCHRGHDVGSDSQWIFRFHLLYGSRIL